jgi:hypothetical protein
MRTGLAFSGGNATEPRLTVLTRAVLTTGVVPRSGVTAPADEPTVESGCVPVLSTGATVCVPVLLAGTFVCVPLTVAFFVSSAEEGALEAGVGVACGGADFCGGRATQ